MGDGRLEGLGFGFRGFGFEVQTFRGFEVCGFGVIGFEVRGLRFEVRVSEFGVQGLGLGVKC